VRGRTDRSNNFCAFVFVQGHDLRFVLLTHITY
jgi:hypothetical protein